MRTSFLSSSKAGMALLVACLSVFASCSKKNDPIPEPVGDIKVKSVNAVRGSASQDFYINDTKKNTQVIAYGSASEYFTVTSGNNTFKFYNAGTTTLTAESQAYNIPIGLNVTAFYLQSPSGQFGVFPIGDDVTTPAAGKARVRFLYFNSFLPTTSVISVSVVGQTTPLIGALGHLLDPAAQASYYNVDAGTKFKFAANGVTDAPELDPGIVAGKIYTIWIDGSSATNLTGHVIVQN
jgi:hypothetical protein